MKSKYYVFGPVRDSETSIGSVMQSLIDQTRPPEKIIIVDDGSTDKTGEILEEFRKQNSDKIEILKTNSMTTDFKRLPSLWNMCLQERYDYHMIINGDSILERDYAEKILGEMETDPSIVVASGDFGKSKSHSPHGAGRFVKQDFFYKFYEKYHEKVGSEDHIVLMALIKGYKIKVFNDVKFEHTDQLGHKHNFGHWGYSMRVLGFHPLHVLGRIAKEFIKNTYAGRRGACNILWKYLTFKPDKTGYYGLYPKEYRDALREYQKKRILERLKKRFS